MLSTFGCVHVYDVLISSQNVYVTVENMQRILKFVINIEGITRKFSFRFENMFEGQAFYCA